MDVGGENVSIVSFANRVTASAAFFGRSLVGVFTTADETFSARDFPLACPFPFAIAFAFSSSSSSSSSDSVKGISYLNVPAAFLARSSARRWAALPFNAIAIFD